MVSFDPEAIRNEASKWMDLADRMSIVRAGAEGLGLAPSAFFIGNLSEAVHHPAYDDFLGRVVTRLSGGEAEFELIGTNLRRIADNYEDGEDMNRRSLDEIYSVTPEEVENATRSDGGESGVAHPPQLR